MELVFKYLPLLIVVPFVFWFGFMAWNGRRQKDEDAIPLLGLASVALILLPLIVLTTGN